MRHELGLRIGLFLSAAPLANTFAGALAYGITNGDPGLAKWRVLFLVEGLPTVLISVVVWIFLPDNPEEARFLTEQEKAVARARGIRQAGLNRRMGEINLKEMLAGLTDLKGWILGVSIFALCERNKHDMLTTAAHVLLWQCGIQQPACVSANDLERDGVLHSQCSRSVYLLRCRAGN